MVFFVDLIYFLILQVIAQTGKKQVGRIVAGERGELVTLCGIINAIGNSLPPVG